MAIWLIRAGKHGEDEQKFQDEEKVYVMWHNLDVDLAKLKDRSELTNALRERYPDSKPKTITSWVSQIWPFASEITKDDLVVLPLKTQRAIRIGKVVGDYHFEPNGPNPSCAKTQPF